MDLFNHGLSSGKAKDDADIFSFPAVRWRQSEAELLADLRAFGTEFTAEDRTMQNYREWPKRKFHDHTIIAQLGSWVGALKLAGLSHDTRRRDAPTKSDVEAELRKFASTTPVARRTFANFKVWRWRRVSSSAVARHFGNWHDALKELGIAVPGQTKSEKHSDEEILAVVERIWRWCGRPPSVEDFKKYTRVNDDGISFGTIYYRFGALKPFLAAFAQWKNGKISKSELLMRAQTRRMRDPIPVGVRFRVLRERNSTCDACGRGPKLKAGTVLEIDHIIPVSKGGTNDPANLQVLCQSCNRGKGNRFVD